MRILKMSNYVKELGGFLRNLKKNFHIEPEYNNKVKLIHQLDDSISFKDMSMGDLGLQHVLCHQFYPLVKKDKLKGWTEEKLVNRHLNIINELSRRNTPHLRVDRFDEITTFRRKVYKG